MPISTTWPLAEQSPHCQEPHLKAVKSSAALLQKHELEVRRQASGHIDYIM